MANIPNTGVIGCLPQMSVIGTLALMPVRSGSSENFIDLTTLDTNGKLDLNPYIYNADPSKRLYIIKDVVNYDPETGDSLFEEFTGGYKNFIQFAGTTVKAQLPAVENGGMSYQQVARLQAFMKGCTSWMLFLIDENGNILGRQIEIGKLIGLAISGLDVKQQWKSTAGRSNVGMISFNLPIKNKLSQLWQINGEELADDYSLATGILDVTTPILSAGTSSIALQVLPAYYGSGVAAKANIDTLVKANFKVEVATGTAPNILWTVKAINTMTLDDHYHLNFTTPFTSGDKIRTSIITSATCKYEGPIVYSTIA